MAGTHTFRSTLISLAFLAAACGSSRNVSEGGEPTHPTNFAQAAVHGPAAKADLASCKLCHGPALAGGFGPSCATCHEAAGFANWTQNCTFCHGAQRVQAFTAADLPKAAPATGQHAQHVAGGALGKAMSCENCHGPIDGLAHVNGTVTVAFTGIGGAGGATGTFAGGTCSNVYCHGGGLEGAAKPNVSWTAGGALVCGDCHTLNPTSGGASGHAFHLGTAGATCVQCHRGYGGIDLENHVSGTAEAVLADGTKFTAFDGNCGTCHAKFP